MLGAADLHLHTRASDGLVAARDLVDFVELTTNLDVIAITDHDETSASLDGREWAARQGFRIQVVPGVEVLNASLAGRGSRPHALRLARDHGLAQIGASDAHMASMVGLARTRFAGRTAEDLRRAIEGCATQAEGRFATPAEMAAEAIPQLARSMVHLPLRRIVRYARSRRVPNPRTL